MKTKLAIIVGAGPAGLTAAYELLAKTDIKPIIIEASNEIGGLSRTVNYKGNRIDIGGHRFFSKSDRIMDWWLNILPLEENASESLKISYQNKSREVTFSESKNDKDPNNVMLIRKRVSRILHLRKFFNYPISLDLQTLQNLGVLKVLKITFSYLKAMLFKIKKEKSLEDFFINKFGRELYMTFFKDYTEKVWGISCSQIKPEWGAQRIKNLSILKAVVHALKKVFQKDSSVEQKNTETSLIERFLFPKFGTGHMWEEVSRLIKEKGGEIITEHSVTGISFHNNKITGIRVQCTSSGEIKIFSGDYFFSSMPVKELISCFGDRVPFTVKTISDGLIYRDFITVGLLLKQFGPTDKDLIPDTWIYIQEKDVKLGRIQIYNNWSPFMVKDPKTAWLGLEYFCNRSDDLWKMPDSDFIKLAIDELLKINLIKNSGDVIDHTIIRVKNAYPSYSGTYGEINTVKDFLNGFENLFLVGRNGMHKYNNQDHSMLSAMHAVDNIVNDIKSKENIWAVNTEEEFLEKATK